MNLKGIEWSSKDYNGLFENKISSQLLQNTLLEKEVWRIKEDLGLDTLEHRKVLTINFTKIQPLWFKLLTKLYILKRASIKISSQYIRDEVGIFRGFAKFLIKKKVEKAKYIDNNLFEEFDYWIRANKVSESTIINYYISLDKLFDTCRTEGWLNINIYWFKGKKKISKPKNDDVNYIPEEVWNKLEENLCYFPEPMQRKVLVIRTLGLRVGELLNLPFDCLRKRENQWRLRLKETEKFGIEGDEMPIPLTLVPIIKEQQKYISENFENSYNKLWCSNCGGKNFDFRPVARVMGCNTFNRWLNKLAEKHKICSKNGEIWHFTSHQFRRTVGTIMTNAGVRDLIIQKYLRHRNPDMQMYYKHLLKEVIGDEYQELIEEKNFVNIEGKVVATHKPQDAIEEYMRLRMHQITTQQGECHRSNLKNACPTVNGCWRCGDWMTSEKDLPYLKQDLERLKDELEKADNLGMVRVVKEIHKDINFLQIRINTLEEVINSD